LWFDPIGDLEHLDEQPTLVGSFRAAADQACRYRDEMAGLYPGVRVTIDEMPDPPPMRDLPAEQLWSLTPC
jgi:hypothetical protein